MICIKPCFASHKRTSPCRSGLSSEPISSKTKCEKTEGPQKEQQQEVGAVHADVIVPSSSSTSLSPDNEVQKGRKRSKIGRGRTSIKFGDEKGGGGGGAVIMLR